jgi:Arc/MetJ-type ribon-helix-helix transcriptional regulator
MAHVVTNPQKRLLRELLKVGRWNNESEIIRYGLHLVAKEVTADETNSLAPISKDVLTRAYRKLGKDDLRDAKVLEAASSYPTKGELE